ncbi:hypothetical protein [Maribacter sp. ACAM166]|uniref:hypothetical protein n=1 Tax=Maribacter sp. ACAM166 TaxID=2508996 RepID=UPI0010FDDCDB|nr:hypothetical protein [Maribacter sp. ACAM166]TLP80188.1 hypothetical protein ES765_09440 [Maribacter sp. ACAM166]
MKNSMTIPMTHSGSKKRVNPLLKWYNGVLTEFKKDQTGYAAIAIIAQSCLGSAAVMLLLMNEMPMAVKMTFVFLITILCMGYNAAVLAQLKSKITFNMLIVSVVFSSAVIIANLF